MTQEDKELLLKDLYARLPYGVKICYTESEYGIKSIWNVDYIYPKETIVCKGPYGRHNIERCQLYLRPMSSMTKDEEKELHEIYHKWLLKGGSFNQYIEVIDWCHQHHFDYRGLIEKGLALEAPEGMYNINEK